jgi:hypothetical protein
MILEILRDERGTLSAARVLLTISMAFVGVLIVLDSIVWEVPESAYVLLGSWGIGLLAWAGGPRIAQYVGPQIGAVASGIAQAAKDLRRPELLDNDPRFKEHDEG